MQVLKILSLIWKSGAEIYRDKSDGRLALKNADRIPLEILKAAEPIFNQIDEWFKSWENALAADITIWKALSLYCGWQSNEKMNEWICNDEEAITLFYDWTVALAKNGWADLYVDHREFENDESNALKNKFYERARLWSSRNK